MKKRIRTLVQALLWTGLLAMAAISPAAAQAPDLDSVCAGLTAYEVTAGAFEQTRSSPGLKRPLKSGGSFIICGEGIAWKTERPFSSLLSVGKDRIIQAAADGKKTVIDGSSNQTFKSIAQTMAALFSGDKETLEKNFHVTFSPAAGSGWTMGLVPRDSIIAAAIKEIVLTGESGTESFIQSAKIQEQNGSSIEYAFSGQIHKTALNDEEKACFLPE